MNDCVTIVMSNMSVPPLPKRYGMLSLIKSVDADGGRFILDDDRIEAT